MIIYGHAYGVGLPPILIPLVKLVSAQGAPRRVVASFSQALSLLFLMPI